MKDVWFCPNSRKTQRAVARRHGPVSLVVGFQRDDAEVGHGPGPGVKLKKPETVPLNCDEVQKLV